MKLTSPDVRLINKDPRLGSVRTVRQFNGFEIPSINIEGIVIFRGIVGEKHRNTTIAVMNEETKCF
jgi:hypothetical protein